MYVKQKFDKGIMAVGAMTSRGGLPLIKVPPNVKVNSVYYVEKVLKPFLEDSVAKLYPSELHNVFAHHDKVSSHTSR